MQLNFPNDENVVSSAAVVQAALEAPGTGITSVHVTRSPLASGGASGVSWTVTFLAPLGNVPTLRVNSTDVGSALALRPLSLDYSPRLTTPSRSPLPIPSTTRARVG